MITIILCLVVIYLMVFTDIIGALIASMGGFIGLLPFVLWVVAMFMRGQ